VEMEGVEPSSNEKLVCKSKCSKNTNKTRCKYNNYLHYLRKVKKIILYGGEKKKRTKRTRTQKNPKKMQKIKPKKYFHINENK